MKLKKKQGAKNSNSKTIKSEHLRLASDEYETTLKKQIGCGNARRLSEIDSGTR